MAATVEEDRCQRDEWVLVQDDEDFRGVLVIVDPASGDALSLSARHVADVNRWEGVMPSLASYPGLRTLDLTKCRYITHLDESVGQLKDLQRLSLARCERITTLPHSIGSLENLQEVRFVCTQE
jgi:hypothetical protein